RPRNRSFLVRSLHFAATAAVCRCYYSLDGPDASLSFFWEPLSPLNTPTNLPKKPFFFFLVSSSDWTPPAASVFPPAVGGGSAFSEFPPNIREKNPCALLFWSQVSRGSVPATKAIVSSSGHDGVARRLVILSSCTSTTPSGWLKGFTFAYWGRATAFFMNSAQMGAAVCAPLSRMSL